MCLFLGEEGKILEKEKNRITVYAMKLIFNALQAFYVTLNSLKDKPNYFLKKYLI